MERMLVADRVLTEVGELRQQVGLRADRKVIGRHQIPGLGCGNGASVDDEAGVHGLEHGGQVVEGSERVCGRFSDLEQFRWFTIACHRIVFGSTDVTRARTA